MYQCQYTCVHTDLMHPHLKFLAQKLILCSGFTQSLEENRYCMHKLHSVPICSIYVRPPLSNHFASFGKGCQIIIIIYTLPDQSSWPACHCTFSWPVQRASCEAERCDQWWDSCQTPPPDDTPFGSPCQGHPGLLKKEVSVINFYQKREERERGEGVGEVEREYGREGEIEGER